MTRKTVCISIEELEEILQEEGDVSVLVDVLPSGKIVKFSNVSEIKGEEMNIADEGKNRALRCQYLLERLYPPFLDREHRRMVSDTIEMTEHIRRVKERLSEAESELLRETMSRLAEARRTGSFDGFTRVDVERLEAVYKRMGKYSVLDQDQEDRLKAIIRTTAEEDFKKGKFRTMEDALLHYGISDKVVEEI